MRNNLKQIFLILSIILLIQYQTFGIDKKNYFIGISGGYGLSGAKLDARPPEDFWSTYDSPEGKSKESYTLGINFSYYLFSYDPFISFSLISCFSFENKGFGAIWKEKSIGADANADVSVKILTFSLGPRLGLLNYFFLGTGAFYSFPLEKAKGTFTIKELDFQYDKEFKINNDYGVYLEAGFNFKISNNLGLEISARYEHGISKIYDQELSDTNWLTNIYSRALFFKGGMNYYW